MLYLKKGINMITISLRTDASISYFRRNLLKILDYPHFTKVVICSGYFQESYNSSPYNILDDGILSSILGNPNSANIEYTIIAGKFNNLHDPWKKSFNTFLRNLRHRGINFRAYTERRGKWHAKIALGIEHDITKVALLGSSNLTRPAFCEPYTNFNVEADILLLVNEQKLINSFNIQENSSQHPLSEIIANLSNEYNQANIEERIQAINDNFFENNLLEEYYID